jgi:hypothetical protein
MARVGPRARLTYRVGRWMVGCAVLTLWVVTTPVASANRAAGSTPQGWIARSAYGLQLSVPASWTVGFFQGCAARGTGTLLIGTPQVLLHCAETPASEDVVWMQPLESSAASSGHTRRLVIHGLRVVASTPSAWVIPSEHVAITAVGTRSRAVLDTLRAATPRAEPAPGMLRGSENLIALTRTPVTGPISILRRDAHRPGSATVQAYDGQFWDALPPGHYRLTGHAGDAPCPPVMVTVTSGVTVQAPEIDCQGE